MLSSKYVNVFNIFSYYHIQRKKRIENKNGVMMEPLEPVGPQRIKEVTSDHIRKLTAVRHRHMRNNWATRLLISLHKNEPSSDL